MAESASNRVRDPVCGMMIDPAKAAAKFDYQGQTYYFCNPGCLKKFQAQPDVYLSSVPVPSGMQLPVLQPQERVASDAAKTKSAFRLPPSALIYVSPMDPEIRQQGPGT